MRKSLFLSFLIILICASASFAQKPLPLPVPPPLAPGAAQWEYLVLEFGGNGATLISAEKDAARAKVGWREDNYGGKLVRYGDNAGSQAVLDDLGRVGWELVSVTPSSEGNLKSYIFKRLFSQERSQRETAEIEKTERDIRADIKPVTKREPLIDLDRADIKAADDAIANQAKARLEQAIKNSGLTSIAGVRTYYNSYSRETWAELSIDGSASLLKDGNKFRTSDAKKYVNELAAKLFAQSGLQQIPGTDRYYFEDGRVEKRGEIVVNLTVFIKHNGRDNNVSRGSITGNWLAINKQE